MTYICLFYLSDLIRGLVLSVLGLLLPSPLLSKPSSLKTGSLIMRFIFRSICSCTFKAIARLFRVSQKGEEDPISNDRDCSVFSVEPSQGSSVAPMSSLIMSSDQSSSFLLSQSSMIGGYGTTESYSSPDSSDPGKNLSSIFTAASDSAVSSGSKGALVLVTPLENDTMEIVAIKDDSSASAIRPFNLNATHFQESTLGLGVSVQSITPSEYGGSSRSKVNRNSTIASDASSSSTTATEELKKKYPVTPYPKLAEAFSSPTYKVKKISKLPRSVITMRRGLVRTRVGHIQKKLDRKVKEETCA